MSSEHFDVVIIGAGISGICAAHYLQKRCPGKSYVILEQRSKVGGTWDLWRYPGVRSDSDMYSFSFSFRPWDKGWNLSPGQMVREYLADTVEQMGIVQQIRFDHEVKTAAFSSENFCWTLETTGSTSLTGTFLFLCTGYYKYDGGYVPPWPGVENFQGELVRPMAWPDNIDVRDKRILVIGSGATSVSLVPALAATAKEVIMVQRSPTYMATVNSTESAMSSYLRRHFPQSVYSVKRAHWIWDRIWTFWACKAVPSIAARKLIGEVMSQLPSDISKEHFTPRYAPWDQRIAAIADGDLFRAIRDQKVNIVTDTIREFTEGGIVLGSGKELDADIIVAATGFNLQLNYPMNNMEVTIDGKLYRSTEAMVHRGMMLSDVPNCAFVMGYTNSSWTLRAEIVCDRVCRLLQMMEAKGYKQCCPRRDVSEKEEAGGFGHLISGYVARSRDYLPKAGTSAAWRAPPQNYLVEQWMMERSALKETSLEFVRGCPPARL
eukprot:TRINITY_DN43022_c0_g1_i1.p1 TRINITY_DN43022_c0_g1~~TRINITY_DN43022_c0_g1_i1.p1  ORF type:complete len:510 (-),score=78.13 TRINITY_DN43022_c0_g1_i1:32-1504(-)